MRLCCEGQIIYLQDVLEHHHSERNKLDKLLVCFGLRKLRPINASSESRKDVCKGNESSSTRGEIKIFIGCFPDVTSQDVVKLRLLIFARHKVRG